MTPGAIALASTYIEKASPSLVLVDRLTFVLALLSPGVDEYGDETPPSPIDEATAQQLLLLP